jgi:hypothetical protein
MTQPRLYCLGRCACGGRWDALHIGSRHLQLRNQQQLLNNNNQTAQTTYVTA